MPAQIAGLAPATRVASRKLGPTAGSRSPRSSAAGGLGDEHVGEHVRQVAETAAIMRSCVAGSIACGRAPSP